MKMVEVMLYNYGNRTLTILLLVPVLNILINNRCVISYGGYIMAHMIWLVLNYLYSKVIYSVTFIFEADI